MRVEQQSQNIIDVVKQSIGPEEKSGAVLSQYTTGAAGAAVEKSSVSDNAKSVNLKDATYAKPAAEDKQTVAEEIEASATLDAEERKNQMAVLSNTTSPEDYAKMQEDGFSLDDTTTNTIVTETDKIKAQLAKAGVDISFFGDDLDYEQMAAITGSEALARQLAQAMKEADLPCTEENVRGVMEVLSLAQTLQTPGDGAVKYMLDNGMEPTIGNLYKAEYSGSAAYQANPEAAVDMTMFSDQIDAIIARAGLSVDDTSKEACQWLLDNSVPLNEENLAYYMELKNLSLPVQAEALLGSAPRQETLLGQIKEILKEKGYGGLDVDFEYIRPELGAAYAAFVDRLRRELNPLGCSVLVALAPKTFAGQRGLLYEAHDYAALGRAANGVLLMTYEWGYTAGPPMAVAPLDKVRQVVDYALTEIPAEKLFLGVPVYGYDWPLPFREGVTRGGSVSPQEALALARRHGAEIRYDETAQAPWFRYTAAGGREHEVWFEDARSSYAKFRLAAEKGLQGVGLWNLMRPAPQTYLALHGGFEIEEVR